MCMNDNHGVSVATYRNKLAGHINFKTGTKIGEDIVYGKHLRKARARHRLHCSLQVLYKRQFWLEKKWNWWAADRRRV